MNKTARGWYRCDAFWTTFRWTNTPTTMGPSARTRGDSWFTVPARGLRIPHTPTLLHPFSSARRVGGRLPTDLFVQDFWAHRAALPATMVWLLSEDTFQLLYHGSPRHRVLSKPAEPWITRTRSILLAAVSRSCRVFPFVWHAVFCMALFYAQVSAFFPMLAQGETYYVLIYQTRPMWIGHNAIVFIYTWKWSRMG